MAWGGFGRLLFLYAILALLGMQGQILYQVAANATGLFATLVSLLTGLTVGLFLLPLALITVRRKHKADFTIGNVAHHVERVG